MKQSDVDILRKRLEDNALSRKTPKPPPRAVTIPTEAEEMERLCIWLHSQVSLRGCWAHVPNERVNKVERFKLSRLGVSPGVPDVLIFARPPCGAVGCAVELKRSDLARPSDLEYGASESQRSWLMTLRVCGWHARVCYGSDHAMRWIAEVYRL